MSLRSTCTGRGAVLPGRLLLGLAAVLAAALAARKPAATVPRTIVLVSIDTLRSDRLPAYGYRFVATPAII